MDHIVIDVEIQKTIDETPGGWDATDKLGVSVACVWEYKTQRMRIYGPEDVERLKDRLFAADLITGFNIFNFDFPVIWALSRPQWLLSGEAFNDEGEAYDVNKLREMLLPKTNDILRRIWLSCDLDPDNFNPKTHGGFSLDKITRALFGVSKIGYGGDAPKWFQAGQWAKLTNYCADDVALERDLSDFIDRYGWIIDPRIGEKLFITAKPRI